MEDTEVKSFPVKRAKTVCQSARSGNYVLSPGNVASKPTDFEAVLDELADEELYQKVLARKGEQTHAIEVNVDEI